MSELEDLKKEVEILKMKFTPTYSKITSMQVSGELKAKIVSEKLGNETQEGTIWRVFRERDKLKEENDELKHKINHKQTMGVIPSQD